MLKPWPTPINLFQPSASPQVPRKLGSFQKSCIIPIFSHNISLTISHINIMHGNMPTFQYISLIQPCKMQLVSSENRPWTSESCMQQKHRTAHEIQVVQRGSSHEDPWWCSSCPSLPSVAVSSLVMPPIESLSPRSVVIPWPAKYETRCLQHFMAHHYSIKYHPHTLYVIYTLYISTNVCGVFIHKWTSFGL